MTDTELKPADNDLWICRREVHLPGHDGATGYYYFTPIEPFAETVLPEGWTTVHYDTAKMMLVPVLGTEGDGE